MDKPLTLDEALDGKHLVGAVGYKRIGPMLFVLAYQHAQKDGVHFGTKQILCYEFELNCLALNRHIRTKKQPYDRHAVHDVLVHRSAVAGPQRPPRFAESDPADIRG